METKNITILEQNFDEYQQAQARENIGAEKKLARVTALVTVPMATNELENRVDAVTLDNITVSISYPSGLPSTKIAPWLSGSHVGVIWMHYGTEGAQPVETFPLDNGNYYLKSIPGPDVFDPENIKYGVHTHLCICSELTTARKTQMGEVLVHYQAGQDADIVCGTTIIDFASNGQWYRLSVNNMKPDYNSANSSTKFGVVFERLT